MSTGSFRTTAKTPIIRNEPEQTQHAGMLTTMQVKERLNVGTVFKVYEMTRSKKLRYHKFGGRTLRFDPDELEEDIQKFKVEAARTYNQRDLQNKAGR